MLGISWIFFSAMLLGDSTVTSLNQSDDEYKTAEVALQSVLGLNNTNQSDAIKLLDKVEKVIGNIKSVFEGKNIVRPANNDEKLAKFTDFIQNLIKRLIKYDDKDLVYFVTIFNNEIRKYNYKGCKFHELLENLKLRMFLSNMLNDLQNQSGRAIKNSLEIVSHKIEQDKFNKNERYLVDFINSMYGQDSLEKFQNFLYEIDTYKLNSDKMDLSIIIKEGMRSILFDYYSHLNNNARDALKHQVNDFWDNLYQNKPFELEESFNSPIGQNFENNVNRKKKLTAKDIFDSKLDLQKVIMKSEVKKQSLYLLNSNNTPNTNKVRSFRNDESVAIKQKTLSDDEFISVKDQKMNDESGVPTVSPMIFTTRILKTRRKMLTFQTLYPDLVPEWTSLTQVPSRRFMSYRYPMRHYNAERRKLFRKRGRMKGSHSVNKTDVFAKVKVADSHLSRLKKKSIKMRHRMPIMKIDLRSRKPVGQLTTYKTEQKKQLRPFRKNADLRTSKLRRHRLREHTSFMQIKNNHRRSNIPDSINSEEGLSIDISEVHDNKFRRSNTNFTVPETGQQQVQITRNTPKPDSKIHNNTVIIRDIKNDLAYSQDRFIRSKEVKNDLNKGQNTVEVRSKVENANLKEVNVDKTFDPNTQINSNLEPHEIQSKEIQKTVSNNEKTNVYVQHKQDESPIFNFRAKISDNETDIESNRYQQNNDKFTSVLRNNSKAIEPEVKDDTKQVVNEEMPMYDENKGNKDSEMKNVKTNVDFRTFIEDYDNDLKEFTHHKITMGDRLLTARLTARNNNKKVIDTRTASTLSSTTTSVTEDLTTTPPAIAALEQSSSGSPKISPANEKQDLADTTTIRSFFDAKLFKHLMMTKKQTTTTTSPSLALGRYFNRDGVVIDSMEKLKEEVAEATNFNYGEQ